MNDSQKTAEDKLINAIGDRIKNEPGMPITDHYLAGKTTIHPGLYLGLLYRLRHHDGPYIEADDDFLTVIIQDHGGTYTMEELDTELLKIRGLTLLGWNRYNGRPPVTGGFTNR